MIHSLQISFGGIVRKFVWMLVIGAALLAQSASATMITQTVSWGTTTPWSATYNLGQFDPSLGTLTSVQLDFSGSAWGTLTLEQKANNVETISSSFGATLTLSDALQNPILTLQPTNSYTDTFSNKQTIVHTVPTGSAAQDSDSVLYVSDLARWIGTGNWSVTGSAANYLELGRNNSVKPTASTFANASLLLTYTYDDKGGSDDPPQVPEPGAFLLIGSGLIGLCMLLRKRSA